MSLILPGSPEMKSALNRDFDLTPSLGAAKDTAEIYQRVKTVIPEPDWARHAPYVLAINKLKREKDAVILAHNYMTPDIFHGISDFVGDSLALAIEASKTPASVIVQCGVHFMAETSKVLSPEKTVLIPDMEAGCSLAESITAADVETMRQKYPGAPVVTYVNTTAAVKAASDICCTSGNALAIVEAQDSDTVIMTPDGHLAQNIAKQSSKRIVWWAGACVVHERFTAQEMRDYREWHPDVFIIAHPECPTDVVAEADYTGSTAGMIKYVRDNRPKEVLLVTECSMASNISQEVPETTFLGPCNLCPYMQKITMEKVLWSLHTMTTEVTIDPALQEKAARAVQRMLDIKL